MKTLLVGCGATGQAMALKIYDLPFISSLDLYSRSGKTAVSLQNSLKSPKVNAIQSISEIYNLIIVALSGMSSSERWQSFHDRPTTYMVRQDELKFNLGGIIELIPILKKQKKARIIVITNPVDEVTNFLNLRLNRKDIIGFGLELDAVRYGQILNSAQTFCFGTHGKAFPVLNDNVKKHYTDIYNLSDSRVFEFIRRNGMTTEITSNAFRKFILSFYSKDKTICQFTYYVKNNSEYPFGLSYGLPRYVQNGKVLGLVSLNLNKIENSILLQVTNQLKQSLKRLILAEEKLQLYR
jgi:malate/lactate dehydrogenase